MAEETHQTNLPDVIIVSYNIFNLGGVPRSTTTIANGLSRHGYSVKIASIAPGMVPITQEIDSDIEIFTCNPEVPPAQQFYASGIGRKLRAVAVRVFRKWKPRNLHLVRPTADGVKRLADFLGVQRLTHTVLIVTDVNSMDYVNLALKTIPKPAALIGQYRGTVGALDPSRARRIAEAFAAADLVLLLTEQDARDFSSVTNVQCDWVPNPVPISEPPQRAVQRAQEVVTMGRLAPEKGIDKAISAWSLVAARHPSWKLRIFGDGPIRNRLEAQIVRARLTRSVSIEGKTEAPLDVLQRASIHLLPSQHEGFGMSIAEAATVSTPTVAFDCSPGVRSQIVDEVNGRLVPLNDVPALAEALTDLIDDPERLRRLGASAAESVRRFSVDAIVSRWDKILVRAQRIQKSRNADSQNDCDQ